MSSGRLSVNSKGLMRHNSGGSVDGPVEGLAKSVPLAGAMHSKSEPLELKWVMFDLCERRSGRSTSLFGFPGQACTFLNSSPESKQVRGIKGDRLLFER